MTKKSKSKGSKVCTKEEFEQFISIYKRFKQVTKVPEHYADNFSYEQTMLVNDLREFWPVIKRVVQELNIPFRSDFRMMEKLIYRDTITIPASGGEQVTVLRPEGDLDSFMICGFIYSGQNFIYEAGQQLLWPEHDLDTIMVKLCKHFDVKKEELIKSEYPRVKARHETDNKALASTKKTKAKQKDERNILMMDAKSSKESWEAIKKEYDISRPGFGKKINFVKDQFKRKIIFRDVEDAFVLSMLGFSKPAIILAGGVIEELLRLYLERKNIKMKVDDGFFDYINACKNNKLLKPGVLNLTDSVRDFRNLVHLAKETEKKHTITKATAKGAVSSIFTIVNDFQ